MLRRCAPESEKPFDTGWYRLDTKEYASVHVACQAAANPPYSGRGTGPDLGCSLKSFRRRGVRRRHDRPDRQAAGFTKGAVYSNFGSKDELFLALLDREFELRGEQIATTLESGGDAPAA